MPKAIQRLQCNVAQHNAGQQKARPLLDANGHLPPHHARSCPPPCIIPAGWVEEEAEEQHERNKKLATPSLAKICERVKAMSAAAAGGGPVAPLAMAQQIYNLGSRLKMEASAAAGDAGKQQEQVTGCLAQLQKLLSSCAAQPGGTAAPAIHSLPSKELSLTMWALAQIVQWRRRVLPAGTASQRQAADVVMFARLVLQAAEQGPAMSKAGWMDWSRLLYSAAKAGVSLEDSRTLFDQAFTVLPSLLQVKPAASGQDISNLLLAATYVGYSGPLLKQLITAVSRAEASGASAAGVTALGDAGAQALANILWALASLKVRADTGFALV